MDLYRETLLGACVENLQFDRQLEANRAPYLMRILTLAGLERAGRERIETALPGCESGWNRDLMIDLLEEMARAGDVHARTLLFDRAESGETRAQDDLALVDDAGLRWIEANVLPNLSTDDRWRISMWLPDEEADDRTPTQRRLRAADRENDARRDADRTIRPKPKPDAREFLREIKAGRRPKTHPYDFADVATRKQWREAAETLLRSKDAPSAWRIAQAFRRRAFPIPLRRLFPYAIHAELGGAVCEILGEIDAAQVRHFARKLLRLRPLPWNAVSALESSFRPGDEALVLSALPDVLAYDARDLHGVVGDVVTLFRKHPKGAWQPHAEWVYDHSPCAFCRSSAVDWMADHGNLPDWILEEAPYDAEPEIRNAILNS